MSATDCDDGDACNGDEECDEGNCAPGSEAGEGTACAFATTDDGVCLSGECAMAGCGNRFLEDGEDCDDGNADDSDGCTRDCTFTCTRDTDCDNDNTCDGRESCDTTSHVCTPGTTLDCGDGDPCTTDRCDAGTGCEYDLVDADRDGVAPAVCTTPGLDGGDCDDTNASVFPNQTNRFSSPYCPGGGSCSSSERTFDYNCDTWEAGGIYGRGTPRCTTDGISVCEGAAWASTIPRCGVSGSLNECRFDVFGDCRVFAATALQECN